MSPGIERRQQGAREVVAAQLGETKRRRTERRVYGRDHQLDQSSVLASDVGMSKRALRPVKSLNR